MLINGILFNAELLDILSELQRELNINNIPLLQKIKDVGDNIMVQCPYHGNGQERRPSAGIRKSDGTFNCFACGETHTLQEVISYCFGYDDMFGKEGWKWLVKNFATASVEVRNDIVIDCDRKNAVNRRIERQSVYVSDDILEGFRFYHDYMYKRKLTDEIIELFDIGYDAETDCITFPIRDVNGNCLGVARRSTKGKYFNYPTGFEKPLYGIYELSLQEQYPQEVVVCESMLDALSFWVAGKYAVALNGLGSELQMKQLEHLYCRMLILCTDMDEAGMSARSKIRRKIKRKFIADYYLPEGRKDANECTIAELKELHYEL